MCCGPQGIGDGCGQVAFVGCKSDVDILYEPVSLICMKIVAEMSCEVLVCNLEIDRKLCNDTNLYQF
jgi:hypothetical protein